MFGKCTTRQISLSIIIIIIIIIFSICKPIVTVLIWGSLGLPASTEPKGAAIWYNYAPRFMAHGLNFLHIWVRISFTVNEAVFLLRSFFLLCKREKVDSHTHKWSVGKSSALLTTRTPVLLRASAVTYLFSKFPARKFKRNSPGIIQHWPKINHQQYFIQKYVLINRQNKQKCTMDGDSLKKSVKLIHAAIDP